MLRLALITATLLIGCGGIAVIDPGSSSGGNGGSGAATSSSSSTGGTDPNCRSSDSSSLAGVSIHFPPQRCSYSLAEAAAGIEVQYQVVIDSNISDIIPLPEDAGGCDVAHASGLFVFERLAGNGQTYCRCDTGLCPPPPNQKIQLLAGSYDGSFAWDGRNWLGPSDTGNPKGPPFPAGTYELRVTATGLNENLPFQVLGTFDLTLVP